MRAAGCAYNDIVDRDIDAKVARTAGRPVASGRISVKQAWAFIVGCSLVSLAHPAHPGHRSRSGWAWARWRWWPPIRS